MQAERLSDIPLGVKSDRKEGLLWYEDRRIKRNGSAALYHFGQEMVKIFSVWTM